jgi:hypothetical protein
MRTIVLSLLLVLLPLQPAISREIAGIELPEQVYWRGEPLALKGAGVVTHLFSRVLVGALYLPLRQTPAAQDIHRPGLKRIRLHILYDNLSPEELRTLFLEAVAKSLGPEEEARVRYRVGVLTAAIREIRKGDILEIDVFPFRSVHVRLNNESLGFMEDGDLAQAMLAVWFGEKPASRGLKHAMLGEG